MTNPKPLPAPTYPAVITAPFDTFRAWCMGDAAYTHGDLLASAAVTRLHEARGVVERLLIEGGDQLSEGIVERAREFLDGRKS